MSEEEVFFYNWFFAAIALIAGQSVCLTYWFERPVRRKRLGLRHRTTILNDQRFLLNNFLMWFAKLGFLYALFFGISYPGSHYEFSFYPDYAFILVLIPMVLFFQSWNSIRLRFKSQSFKWMIYSLLFIAVASLGLAKINVVDYKKVNAALLANNVFYSNDLQLPHVGTFEQSYFGEVDATWVFFDKDDTTQVRMKVDDRIAPFDPNIIFDGWCSKPRFDVDYRLFMDRRVKMKSVKLIWDEFIGSNIIRVSYGVLPVELENERPYCKDLAFQTWVPRINKDSLELAHYKNQLEQKYNPIYIQHQESGYCLLNNKKVEYNEVAEAILNLYLWNSENIIFHDFSDDLCFEDYLYLRVELKRGIHLWYDYYAWDNCGKNFLDCHHKLQNEIRDKFPLRILEY